MMPPGTYLHTGQPKLNQECTEVIYIVIQPRGSILTDLNTIYEAPSYLQSVS